MWLAVAEGQNQAIRIYTLKHAFADKPVFAPFRARHEKFTPPPRGAGVVWHVCTAIFAQQPAIRTAIFGLVRGGHAFLSFYHLRRCPDSGNAVPRAWDELRYPLYVFDPGSII